MHSPMLQLSRQAAQRVRTAGPLQWGAWVLTLAAGVVGLLYGYAFGVRLSGTLLGVVLAVNGAVLCSMVADALLERVARLR
jgi:hypothetical protein